MKHVQTKDNENMKQFVNGYQLCQLSFFSWLLSIPDPLVVNYPMRKIIYWGKIFSQKIKNEPKERIFNAYKRSGACSMYPTDQQPPSSCVYKCNYFLMFAQTNAFSLCFSTRPASQFSFPIERLTSFIELLSWRSVIARVLLEIKKKYLNISTINLFMFLWLF